MKPQVSIILPTYNESENIGPLIRELNTLVKQSKEIIVVDDNSPDGTSNVVQKLIDKKSIKNLRLKTRKKDRGLTKSISEGIKMAKGEIIVWMDCDFSHPPKVTPKLLEKIDQGYDIAVASRFVKGGSCKKNFEKSTDSPLLVFLSISLNIFAQLLLGNNFKDYTSGYIAVRKNVFKIISLKGNYGEYFIDLIARAKFLNFKIIEIPYKNVSRKYGESKSTLSISRVRYLFTIFSLAPLRFKHMLKRIS